MNGSVILTRAQQELLHHHTSRRRASAQIGLTKLPDEFRLDLRYELKACTARSLFSFPINNTDLRYEHPPSKTASVTAEGELLVELVWIGA